MASTVSRFFPDELDCQRAVSAEGGGLVLSLLPSRPLSAADRNRLLLESVEAEAIRIPGILPVVDVQVGREQIRIVSRGLDARSMSLHTFSRALSSREAVVPLPLAELLARDIGAALASLAAQPASGFFQPVHGRLRPGAIVLEPGGRCALIGGGFPLITGLLVPPGRTSLEDRRLLAPEILRGEESTPRSDVYALAAILFELITAVPYLQGTTESRLEERARSYAAPEFPAGIRLPTQHWVALLSSALAPSPEDRPASVAGLAESISAMRAAAGLPRWSNEILGTLVERLDVSGVGAMEPRGASTLLGLRGSPAREPSGIAGRSAEPSITRENLFDDLGLERKPPPPPPPLSDPPAAPMEMPAFRRPLSHAFAEAVHSTDEMVQAERTELQNPDRTPVIYGAALFLFGTALVLTVLTLFLFLTS